MLSTHSSLRDSTRDWLGYVSVYYDAYNPAARELCWSQINKTLVPAGVDAWWMDASEPEVISDASPAEMAGRMTPGISGTGLEFLNAYSLFNSKEIYENQRKVRPEDRVCILTRSGFAGQQKYAAVSWSGDITSRWDVLKAQIPAGLSFSISGIPYWTTDIGAFSVDFPGGNTNAQYRELFVRWYQFGTFCPVFRVHGSDTPREIWYFGDENDPEYSIQLKFSRLRYRLLPYIYALAGKVNLEHYTLMRPLVMDFPLDPIGWNTDDQYMFGTAFMVCPVTEKGSVDRPVYLPDGGWYDFWYGHYLEGGHSISASAPITTMPLFVREGSVVPLGPDLQYTNEKLPDTIRLLIYTGKSGSFDLYEDDGISNACEDGAYTVIPIRWDEEKRSLQIGKQEGDYKDKIKKRVFEISWITREKPVGYNELPDPDERVVYNGSGVRITMK
ncbi:MAG: glycoside hydrolase family 31 protein [Bacteroidales bacterium]